MLQDFNERARKRWLREYEMNEAQLEKLFDDIPARRHEVWQKARALAFDAIRWLALIGLFVVLFTQA
jgi:hypothetical protein